MAYKGQFHPTNPSKYRGNVTNIVYRSLWEKKLMVRFDTDPSIIQWSSEEVIVPYVNPIKSMVNKKRTVSRYFVDFWIMYRTRDNEIKEMWIEVKPEKETMKPEYDPKHPRRSKKAAVNYAINTAKWEAAKALGESLNIDFQIWTEKVIFSSK